MDSAYFGREQTFVKHSVLEQYVPSLALIVGRNMAPDISYIDCCSGPWNTVARDLSDSSIGIALEQLRIARDRLAADGRRVTVRCLFVEKNRHAYAKLQEFCNAITNIEVETLFGDFTEHIPKILRFVTQRTGSFPFFFIDPTGWQSLKITALTPLLQTRPGEVLINFMTSHIRRFLESEGKDFRELLGQQALDNIRGLTGQDRDDAAAFAYTDQVQRAGNFPYGCTAIVVNPQHNRTHFHLIYATRHPRGVEVFKDVERRASNMMALVRAGARQRRRMDLNLQSELFPIDQYEVRDDRYLHSLRSRYLDRARQLVEKELILHRRQPIRYEKVWMIACRFPLVWQTDLHKWVHEWRDQGKIQVVGMKPNQRVPKCQAANFLVWTG